jgi:hypothetical protein
MSLANAAWRVCLGLAVASCAPTPSPSVQAPTPSSTRSATATSSTVPGKTANATPEATSEELPNPGGTCSAGQFVLGKPLTFYGYGSAGYALLFVRQSIRNAGADCVLQLPEAIGVASIAGAFQAVPVQITRDPASINVAAGQTVSIVLGDSWWLGIFTEAGETARLAPPCEGRVTDVHRVAYPFASGSIEIGLDVPWHEVCSAPPSVTVTVDDTGAP